MKSKAINAQQFEKARKGLFEILPPLSENIKNWVEDVVFCDSRYMFAYKNKLGTFGYCTHCKEEVPLTYAQRCRHNEIGVCPSCGSKVLFKDAGRGHSNLKDTGYIVAAVPLQDGAIAVRAFFVEKDYSGDFRNVNTKYDEKYRIYFNKDIDCAFKNSWNYLQGSEWERMTVIPNPSVAQPFPYYCKSSWIEPKFYGFNNITFKRSNLKYCAIDEYKKTAQRADEFNPNICTYLDMYVKHPEITEKLIKEGFGKLVWEKLSGKCDIKINLCAKTVSKALLMDKSQLRECRGHGSEWIKGYQFCKEYSLKGEQALSLAQNKYVRESLLKIQKYMEIKKAVKYLTEQEESAAIYLDYLNECRELGFNLKAEGVLFPRILRDAHQQNIEIMTERKDTQRKQEREKLEKNFKNKFLKKWNRLYTFESENLFIRPAQDGDELLKEGRTLRHCVAMLYTKPYLNGKTVILFIRRKSEPDTPFYTAEIKNNNLIQCRCYKNHGMTDEVKNFMDEFLNHINKSTAKKTA